MGLENIVKIRTEVGEILNRRKRTVRRQFIKFKGTDAFLNRQKTGRPQEITLEN